MGSSATRFILRSVFDLLLSKDFLSGHFKKPENFFARFKPGPAFIPLILRSGRPILSQAGGFMATSALMKSPARIQQDVEMLLHWSFNDVSWTATPSDDMFGGCRTV